MTGPSYPTDDQLARPQQDAEAGAAIEDAEEMGWLGRVRLPPSNDRAEMALLGALLTNNLAFKRVHRFLLAEHFADPVHRAIYEVIARRIDAGQIADAVTLKAEFEHTNALEEVGGSAYLVQLARSPAIIDVAEYATGIADAWVRRQLIDLTENIVVQVQSLHAMAFGEFGAGDPLDGVGIAGRLFDGLSEAQTKACGLFTDIQLVPRSRQAYLQNPPF